MIRLYEKEDRKAIENIVSFGLNTNSSSLAHLSDTLERDLNRFDRYAETKWPMFNEQYWVCVVDGEVIGGIGITKIQRQPMESKEMVCLHRLSIDSNYRRMGYASLLLQYLETYVKNQKIRRIRLTTQEDLIPAIHFYNSHGYKCVGKKKWEKLVLLTYEKII